MGSVDPPRELAECSVGGVWDEGVRFVVIEAPPMRAGRGRRSSSPKSRRLATWREQDRCEDIVHQAFLGLRSSVLDATTARALIREADLDEFIRVAASREEVVDAFADFYGLGLYFWSFDRDVGGPGPGVARAIFALRRQLT